MSDDKKIITMDEVRGRAGRRQNMREENRALKERNAKLEKDNKLMFDQMGFLKEMVTRIYDALFGLGAAAERFKGGLDPDELVEEMKEKIEEMSAGTHPPAEPQPETTGGRMTPARADNEAADKPGTCPETQS